MRFKYYLFDFDNTLIKISNPKEYFDEILVKSLNAILVENIPPIKVRNQFWLSGLEYQNLLRKWGGKKVDKFWYYFDIYDYEARKRLIQNNQLPLYSDVVDVLKILRKHDKFIALVSNAANYIVSHIIGEYELEEFFDKVIALGDNKPESLAKPSPLGIQTVLNELYYDSRRSKAIMTGDSRVDVYAAKRAGITACLIQRDKDKYGDGIKGWEYQPDIVIESLYELLDL